VTLMGDSGPIGEITFPLQIHTPWGVCTIQSLNPDDLSPRLQSFLQYVLSHPDRGPKIRQLLGLKPYRRSWWTQNLRRKRRYSRDRDFQRRLERGRLTGIGSTTNM